MFELTDSMQMPHCVEKEVFVMALCGHGDLRLMAALSDLRGLFPTETIL